MRDAQRHYEAIAKRHTTSYGTSIHGLIRIPVNLLSKRYSLLDFSALVQLRAAYASWYLNDDTAGTNGTVAKTTTKLVLSFLLQLIFKAIGCHTHFELKNRHSLLLASLRLKKCKRHCHTRLYRLYPSRCDRRVLQPAPSLLRQLVESLDRQ